MGRLLEGVPAADLDGSAASGTGCSIPLAPAIGHVRSISGTGCRTCRTMATSPTLAGMTGMTGARRGSVG
jgi:hypothetical protein